MRHGLFVALALASGAAFAQGADVGLVNLVSGEVTYAPAMGAPATVKAFMKVRDGDRFDVRAGAQVRVVFFERASQERWTGPASFRATRAGSVPISGTPAEATLLPAGAPQRIAQVPELLQYARLGGIQVRGGLMPQQKASAQQLESIRAAREAYSRMLEDLPADDITPELYLYAALYEHQMYDDMKAVVADMRRKQPESEDVKALEAWVAARASR
jgi:hypothetical protein